MTTYVDLTEVWQEVASGPCLIETKHGNALVHFGDAAPDADSKAYHNAPEHAPGLSYGGTKKAFARRSKLETAIVVTEGT